MGRCLYRIGFPSRRRRLDSPAHGGAPLHPPAACFWRSALPVLRAAMVVLVPPVAAIRPGGAELRWRWRWTNRTRASGSSGPDRGGSTFSTVAQPDQVKDSTYA